jgi:hypothetical protein
VNRLRISYFVLVTSADRLASSDPAAFSATASAPTLARTNVQVLVGIVGNPGGFEKQCS